jgi:nicotinamidase-related amidase
MTVQRVDTAVVFIDPQNDVLSERGVAWGATGASVIENHTRENMERIFKAAKANGYEVFISPHYFYPTDYGWHFNGPLESDEVNDHTFAQSGPLELSGLANSGADWLDRFKPHIEDGKTIVVSPHKRRPAPRHQGQHGCHGENHAAPSTRVRENHRVMRNDQGHN